MEVAVELAEISVIGAGYVGLVTAASLAALGFRVRILDVDPARVAEIRAGRSPFFEAGLDGAVREARRTGLLEAYADPGAALRHSDLVLICTGTPLTVDGESDVSQVAAACATVSRHAPEAPVVVRSTLPLGASQDLAGWLDRPRFDTIATNPEFLRQGSALADFRAPARVVVGTVDGRPNRATRALARAYSQIPGPRVLSDFATTEMVKNAANAFLAARLSLVNELADLCEAYGADVAEVTKAIGLDPRIGSDYLQAGIGFGGSCLPKELANLVRLAERKGMTVRALEGAGRSNDLRPTHIADRLERRIGGVRGRRIAILGLSFKAGTDDIRYSPALSLARALIAKGASVVAHDPSVPTAATASQRGLVRVPAPADAVMGSDLTVLATDWPEYSLLDWGALGSIASTRIVYDGRRALDRAAVERAGWEVLVVGRMASGRRRRAAPRHPVAVGADAAAPAAG